VARKKAKIQPRVMRAIVEYYTGKIRQVLSPGVECFVMPDEYVTEVEVRPKKK